jgi:murein L,D-transpeptidase YafK
VIVRLPCSLYLHIRFLGVRTGAAMRYGQWRFYVSAAQRVAMWLAVLIPVMTVDGLKPAYAVDATSSFTFKHLRPLPAATLQSVRAAGVSDRAPIYIRVFKEESELEVLKAAPDGTYTHVKSYPICNFSGSLGPKERYADYQSPEGFYALTSRQMKPDSAYHLAINVGYPNALDQSLGRTGNLIMVHGKCKSVGCFAMTDPLIEEIYAFVRDTIAHGQHSVPLHIFPFRMTEANVTRHAGHPAAQSWVPLEQAYRDFTATRRVPSVTVCERKYVVNPIWKNDNPATVNATAVCPDYSRDEPTYDEATAPEQMTFMANGHRTRTAENLANRAATRAHNARVAQASRIVRRERFKSIMAARDTADTGGNTER